MRNGDTLTFYVKKLATETRLASTAARHATTTSYQETVHRAANLDLKISVLKSLHLHQTFLGKNSSSVGPVAGAIVGQRW